MERAEGAALPLGPGVAKWTLIASILGSSMAFVDGSVVNVALPSIQGDLGGGLATQQSDAAASAIAAWAGAPVVPEPYRPVLRAVLLTGGAPRFLRHGRAMPGLPESLATDEAPWWPPHKIAARELAPYLNVHPELQLQPATH